jgi:hypothetical protein
MTISQTVDIPPSRRITIEIPPEIPAGPVILSFTPVANPANTDLGFEEDCPLCAKSHTPNAETAAAIREGRAILHGEISAKRYNSLNEMWDDLIKEESHD